MSGWKKNDLPNSLAPPIKHEINSLTQNKQKTPYIYQLRKTFDFIHDR